VIFQGVDTGNMLSVNHFSRQVSREQGTASHHFEFYVVCSSGLVAHRQDSFQGQVCMGHLRPFKKSYGQHHPCVIEHKKALRYCSSQSSYLALTSRGTQPVSRRCNICAC